MNILSPGDKPVLLRKVALPTLFKSIEDRFMTPPKLFPFDNPYPPEKARIFWLSGSLLRYFWA
jgi:hypothetical protein